MLTPKEKVLEEEVSELNQDLEKLTEMAMFYRSIADMATTKYILNKEEIEDMSKTLSSTAYELQKTRLQLHQGVTVVKLLLERLGYEQAVNNSYLGNLVNEDGNNEVKLAESWMESTKRRELN